MDNDQEVVREPFEDEESIRSPDHSPNESMQHSYRNLVNNTTTHTANQLVTKEDHNDQHLDLQDDSSSEGSMILQEDADFARSYGINLKTSKTKQTDKSSTAYERLINSSHFDSSKSNSRPILETSVTSDCIYHKGTFYQKGDIVALCDQDDGKLYFAQIIGFLQDQYCEKSASLNWLVPIRPTSRKYFDPSAYRIGLEDMQLRKLDCMTFVRHCPHDYYLRKIYQPEPSSSEIPSDRKTGRNKTKDQAYIWTTMRPVRVPSVKSR